MQLGIFTEKTFSTNFFLSKITQELLRPLICKSTEITCDDKSLEKDVNSLKAHANGRNKSQHCCVLLGVFDEQCCVRLRPMQTDTTLFANNKQHCWAQHVTSVCIEPQQCWHLLRIIETGQTLA